MIAQKLTALGNIAKCQDSVKVFLAGSMNTEWRQKLMNNWSSLTRNNNVGNVVFVDPTRRDWDSSWTTKYGDAKFYQQTKWELSTMRQCDWVIVYLNKDSKSPVSMVETVLNMDRVLLVRDDEFWQAGYIDILCEEFGIPQFDSLDKVLEYLQLQVL